MISLLSSEDQINIELESKFAKIVEQNNTFITLDHYRQCFRTIKLLLAKYPKLKIISIWCAGLSAIEFKIKNKKYIVNCWSTGAFWQYRDKEFQTYVAYLAESPENLDEMLVLYSDPEFASKIVTGLAKVRTREVSSRP